MLSDQRIWSSISVYDQETTTCKASVSGAACLRVPETWRTPVPELRQPGHLKHKKDEVSGLRTGDPWPSQTGGHLSSLLGHKRATVETVYRAV